MHDRRVVRQCSCKFPCSHFPKPIPLHTSISVHVYCLTTHHPGLPPSLNILTHPDACKRCSPPMLAPAPAFRHLQGDCSCLCDVNMRVHLHSNPIAAATYPELDSGEQRIVPMQSLTDFVEVATKSHGVKARTCGTSAQRFNRRCHPPPQRQALQRSGAFGIEGSLITVLKEKKK